MVTVKDGLFAQSMGVKLILSFEYQVYACGKISFTP